MHKDDVRSLSNFLERPGMYIVSTDRANIVSFIHGYEAGAQGRCNFTEMLSDNLAKEYNTKKHATGWSNQIDRYSENKGLSWVETFLQLAPELLVQGAPD